MGVKICPKCKSEEIEMLAGGIIGIFSCRKCNFHSSIFPEKEKQKRKSNKR